MSPPDGDAAGLPALRGRKGGGGQRAPVEAPNTLQSKQVLHAIYLVSQGESRGITGGQDIFLNGVPLLAPDGSANFQGVEWEWRPGTAWQSPYDGIPGVMETIPVGLPVTAASGPAVGPAVDYTEFQKVWITVTVPALVSYDTNTGDSNPTEVMFAIEWRAAGSTGGWTGGVHTISGKNVAPFSRTYILGVPGDGQWYFRIRRITPDSTSSSLQNALTFTTITRVLERRLSYPGCGTVRLKLDAEQWGSQLPQVTFRWGGVLCWVPMNYDPVSRTYAASGPGTSGGVWDGASFKKAWANNPAWLFWTLAVDPDLGCGAEIGPTGADRFTLYEIAQYCDELVPDGFGGMEPRYSFNSWINTRDEALRVLQVLATAFRGMTYWSAGQITARADRPTSPIKAVNPSNVVDGRFEYAGVSLRARHNVVKVRWRDPTLLWRESVEVVQDAELIAEVGFIREAEIDGVGVTSRGLARRFARWLLYTEKYETKMISYRAFRDHADVVPGDIILVTDPAAMGIDASGRLAADCTDGQTLLLDKAFALAGGMTYSVRVILRDGTLSDPIGIAGVTAGNQLSLATPIAWANRPEAFATWMIQVNGAPESYRVMARSEDENGISTVTALRHFPGKFNFIEFGSPLGDDPYSALGRTAGLLAPPTNPYVDEWVGGIGATALLRVTFGWTPSIDRRTESYEIEVRGAGGMLIRQLGTTTSAVDIADLTPGPYTFAVRAVGLGGLVSPWAVTDTVDVDGRTDPPGTVSAMSVSPGVRQITVRWVNPAARHLRGIEVWAAGSGYSSPGMPDFAGNGTAPIPGAPPAGAFTKIGESVGTSFTHTGLLPNNVWHYKIRAVDNFGQAGPFVGPLGARTSMLIAADIADGILNAAKFASTIKPVELIEDLSATAADNTVAFNKADDKLYKRVGGQWVAMVNAQDMVGQITDAQIASIAAAKLTGQITSTQISDDAITTPKLAAGAVTTAELAAGAVTADTIATNAITAVKIAAGAIGADKIAANAITSDKLTAQSVIAGKIAAGAVKATEIAANEIRAVHMASETIITQAAQLGAAVVGSAQIQDAAIVRVNIGLAEIDELRLAGDAVTTWRNGAWAGPITDPADWTMVLDVPFWSPTTRPGIIVMEAFGSGSAYLEPTNQVYYGGGVRFEWRLNGELIHSWATNPEAAPGQMQPVQNHVMTRSITIPAATHPDYPNRLQVHLFRQAYWNGWWPGTVAQFASFALLARAR